MWPGLAWPVAGVCFFFAEFGGASSPFLRTSVGRRRDRWSPPKGHTVAEPGPAAIATSDPPSRQPATDAERVRHAEKQTSNSWAATSDVWSLSRRDGPSMRQPLLFLVLVQSARGRCLPCCVQKKSFHWLLTAATTAVATTKPDGGSNRSIDANIRQ